VWSISTALATDAVAGWLLDWTYSWLLKLIAAGA
jgi:hypothetical protein